MCPTAEPAPRAIPVATIPPIPDIIPPPAAGCCAGAALGAALGAGLGAGLGAACAGLDGPLLKKPPPPPELPLLGLLPLELDLPPPLGIVVCLLINLI